MEVALTGAWSRAAGSPGVHNNWLLQAHIVNALGARCQRQGGPVEVPEENVLLGRFGASLVSPGEILGNETCTLAVLAKGLKLQGR